MTHLLHSCALALVFYLLYRIILKGSQGFQAHRWYLLSIPVVAALLPLFVIPTGNLLNTETVLVTEAIHDIPVLLNPSTTTAVAEAPFIDSITLAWILYTAGAGGALLLFMYKLARIYQWKDDGSTRYINGCYVVTVHNLPTAFSFLNYIFINDAFEERSDEEVHAERRRSTKAEYDQILLHEMTHVREKHSWDLLFYEFLRILFWFHPVAYLGQRDLKLIHEHIADQKTIAVHGRKSYYENLLKQVMNCPDFSFANAFFKLKTIKTRLAMINNTQPKKFPARKLLWMLPILFASLTYTACTTEPQTDMDIDAKMAEFSEGGKYDDVTKAEFDLIKKIKVFESKSMKQQQAMPDEQFTLLEKTRKDYKFLTTGAMTRVDISKSENNEIVTTIEFDDQKLYEAMKKTRFLVDLDQDELKSFAAVMNEEQERISNNETNEFLEMDKLETNNNKTNADVPFAIIENVPTYPGCSGTNAEKKKCMQDKIARFVNKNFNTGLAANIGLTGKQKINTMFTIDKNGNVIDIKTKAESPELQAEATRVINMLPKMKPGMQRGNEVNVIYGYPILFEVLGNF